MIELIKIFKENPVLFSETDKQGKRISAKTVLEAEFSLIWFHFIEHKKTQKSVPSSYFPFLFLTSFSKKPTRERGRERDMPGNC